VWGGSATPEAEIGNTTIQDQLGEKLGDPISTNKPGISGHLYNPSYSGSIGKGSSSESSPSQQCKI
jgi:hypothetical protein